MQHPNNDNIDEINNILKEAYAIRKQIHGESSQLTIIISEMMKKEIAGKIILFVISMSYCWKMNG